MAWFFAQDDKVMRERQWIERIDSEMSSRSQAGAFSFVLILLVSGFFHEQSYRENLLILVFGSLLLVLGAARVYWTWQFESLHGRGATYWRDRFFLLTLVNAATWNLYVILTLLTTELTLSVVLILVYQAAIAGGAAMLYSPFPKFGRIYISLLLLPPALTLLTWWNEEGIALAGLYLLLFGYLMREYKVMTDSFWRNSIEKFKMKAEIGLLKNETIQRDHRQNLSNQLVKGLVRMISTPLTGLLGFISLIEKSPNGSDQTQLIALASRSGQSLIDLLSDIEAYSALRNQSLKMHRAPFNLSRLIEGVMESAGPEAHNKEVELSYLHDFDVPERLVGDGPHLSTILSNFLSMAIQSCRPGELSVKVSSFERSDSPHLRITMRVPHDPEEGLEQEIIQARQQIAANSGDEELAMRNLSLTVSLRLLTLMGGDVDIRNRDEDLLELVLVMPYELSSQQDKSFKPSRQLHGHKVALVGLPPKGSKALRNELQSWQLDVDCLETIEQIRPNRGYDFVLLNFPVSEHSEELQQRYEEAFTKSEQEGWQLLAYCSFVHQQHFSERCPQLKTVPKPVSRRLLHSALLSALEENEN
ncbi:sensor histidine kinase [Salinibius halmophilus]|uniref:sensor histidine kinase n=1 Tax=Salinibius halmophilus TaxID=1853216 RepID=UPI000E665DAD|nr:histidine kinase dimerization/phospho-acceptor domain-containing protein [Salinibius halmophilus]